MGSVWKCRMSQAQQDNHSLRRPSKIPRLEDFIWDEVPSREIPTGQLGFHLLSSLLGLRALGLALVRATHLGSLRAYECRFLKLAFQKHENGSGLRGPSAEEMMAADRRLWEIIAELVNTQKWSLDDALAEVVEVRADMASLLQPRPLLPKTPPPDVPQNYWRPGKGANKGKGKGGAKGNVKGGGKQSSRFAEAPQARSGSPHMRAMVSNALFACGIPLVTDATIPTVPC